MSTHSVSDFAASLVEMAEATRRLPLVEAELQNAKDMIQGNLDRIQNLELRLIDRANEITALQSTIRQLEVARDDAELRFLECDDAKSTLERVLRGLIGEAQGVLEAIRPLPVAPVAAPDTVVTGTPNIDSQTNIPDKSEQDRIDDNLPLIPRDTYQGVKSDDASGQSAADPTPASVDGPNEPQVNVASPLANTLAAASTEGHRADPFHASVQATTDTSTGLEASATSNAPPSADATSPSDPEPPKYVDDHPYGDALNPDWIAWFNRQPGQ